MRLLEEVLLVQSVVLLNDSAVSEQSSAFMADKSNANQLFCIRRNWSEYVGSSGGSSTVEWRGKMEKGTLSGLHS